MWYVYSLLNTEFDTTPTQKSEPACRANNNGILMRELLTRILIYIIAYIIIHNKHKQTRNWRLCAAYSWSLFTGCVSRDPISTAHNDMIMYRDMVATCGRDAIFNAPDDYSPAARRAASRHEPVAANSARLRFSASPQQHYFPVMVTHLLNQFSVPTVNTTYVIWNDPLYLSEQ